MEENRNVTTHQNIAYFNVRNNLITRSPCLKIRNLFKKLSRKDWILSLSIKNLLQWRLYMIRKSFRRTV